MTKHSVASKIELAAFVQVDNTYGPLWCSCSTHKHHTWSVGYMRVLARTAVPSFETMGRPVDWVVQQHALDSINLLASLMLHVRDTCSRGCMGTLHHLLEPGSGVS